MFTVTGRERVLDALIAAAHADPRIVGCALLGSAATGQQDAFSDVDLAISWADGADRAAVVDDWTKRMYAEHGAAHHLDVAFGEVLYRVFLLADTLQIDVSFWPAGELRAIGPAFQLLFGEPTPMQPQRAAPSVGELAGTAWLHAVHARSSIGRARCWQAEFMISGARDQVLALACLRHGVASSEGRGLHLLPEDVTAPLEATLVRSLDLEELARALHAVIQVLLAELAYQDPVLAGRLAGPLRLLVTGGPQSV